MKPANMPHRKEKRRNEAVERAEARAAMTPEERTRNDRDRTAAAGVRLRGAR